VVGVGEVLKPKQQPAHPASFDRAWPHCNMVPWHQVASREVDDGVPEGLRRVPVQGRRSEVYLEPLDPGLVDACCGCWVRHNGAYNHTVGVLLRWATKER
jgi:hypothetical protein